MNKILNSPLWHPVPVREPLAAALQQYLEKLHQTLPLHGGDIQAASQCYGIPVEHWIDLSTGINPEPYPLPELPAQVFQDLPYWQAGFLSAAEKYYGQKHILAIPGSQAAIQALPELLNANCPNQKLAVMTPEVGYQEHAKQWRLAGNPVHHYRSLFRDNMLADIDARLANNKGQHLVVIRPNNPTGVCIDKHQLCAWASALEAGGHLIVDEAFMDLRPKESLLSLDSLPDNIIVCRSFGKFFGLAGIRLGFVFASLALLDKLRQRIGLWPVNGPAQYVAALAMSDISWQAQALNNIADKAALTEQVLSPLVEKFPMSLLVNGQLFLSYTLPVSWALAFNAYFAQGGVLTRVIELDQHRAILRIACLNDKNNADIRRVESLVQQLCWFDNLPEVLSACLEKNP